MIENTLENKAKFFALYLNRKKCIIRQGYINRDNIEPNGVDEYDSLELKHLSSITDEDAIEVAKIRFHYEKYDEFEVSVKDVPFYKSVHVCTEKFHDTLYMPHDANDLESNVCDMHGSITHIVDYLRSRGYLLPWMGLKPDEIIDYGWVKLKKY